MRPTYATAQVRQHEHQALIAFTDGTLMRRAGLAVAAQAQAMLAHLEAKQDVDTPPALGTHANRPNVVALAGPGNNGGDALRAALELQDLGYPVTVALPQQITASATDALSALAQSRQADVPIVTERTAMLQAIENAALILDGLFGIGLTRPIGGVFSELLAAVTNRSQGQVLAIDVPSGIDSDHGCVVGGASASAIRADVTVTMLVDKPGLHTAIGAEHAGHVVVADLDVAPPRAAWPPLTPSTETALQEALTPTAWLIDTEIVRAALSPRQRASHKGDHGDVLLVGGAAGMTGAILLSARAALHAGAGRVFFERLSGEMQPDVLYPEMLTHAQEHPLPKRLSCLVIGPGLGTTALSSQRLLSLLGDALALAPARPPALVLDADALNLLAASPATYLPLLQRYAADPHTDRTGSLVLTPHPLEAARLLGSNVAAIESDRIGAARQLAAIWQAIVVLKGAGTVIAAPDGLCAINTSGNPGLATGGSGDVLAGILGAMLAQMVRASAQHGHHLCQDHADSQRKPWHCIWSVVAAGVWLHGRAADRLVARGDGPIGLTPSALAEEVRRELNMSLAPNAGQRGGFSASSSTSKAC